jgi:hypothetical protein
MEKQFFYFQEESDEHGITVNAKVIKVGMAYSKLAILHILYINRSLCLLPSKTGV